MKRIKLVGMIIILFWVLNLIGETQDSAAVVSLSGGTNIQKDSTYVSGVKFQTSTALILSFGEAIGIGRIYHNKTRSEEYYIMMSGGIGLLGVQGSLYLQQFVFKNPTSTGNFLKVEIGGMIKKDIEFSLSDTFHKKQIEVLPSVSFGWGKSIKLGKESYFRYSIDVGLKASPVNITFTFVL